MVMNASRTARNAAGALLPESDREILEFERAHRVHDGRKEEAIRDLFGISAVRYYDLIGRVIETPAAVRYDPILIRELQESRARRTAARASRVFLPNE